MISKQEREEAIEELLACADTWLVLGAVALPETALALAAGQAMDELEGLDFYTIGESLVRAHGYLEAAALLRDGWNPGEAVCLLKR